MQGKITSYHDVESFGFFVKGPQTKLNTCHITFSLALHSLISKLSDMYAIHVTQETTPFKSKPEHNLYQGSPRGSSFYRPCMGLVYRMTSSLSTFLWRARKPNKWKRWFMQKMSRKTFERRENSIKHVHIPTHTQWRNQLGTDSPKRTRNQFEPLILVWSAVFMKQYCIYKSAIS